MNVHEIEVIIVIVLIITLGLVSIAACLYAIPLCFIRQFHKPIHLLTLNVCIAEFICSTYWCIFYIMNTYYFHVIWTLQSCTTILYLHCMVNCQVFYSLCMVSLNRLLTTVYTNKALFRTNRWTGICIGVQWILAALLYLPVLLSNAEGCWAIVGLQFYQRIYVLIISVVIPTIFLIITNSMIFIYARRSTRRVHATNGENAQAPILSSRDVRLLKHMIFMFVVFAGGWVPIYVAKVINYNGTVLSSLAIEILSTIPAVSLLIDIADLFLYNHELRRYLTNGRQMNRITRLMERTRQ